VLAPLDEDVVDANDASLLLSALAIATHNCNCAVPVFVPVHSPGRRAYYGHFASGEVTVRLDSDSAPETPTSCRYLAGLLDLFQAKSPVLHRTSLQDVSVAVRFTWVKQLQQERAWWTKVGDGHDPGWGAPAPEDSISLQLSASWPEFPEGTLVENPVYSDFRAMQAPNWNFNILSNRSNWCGRCTEGLYGIMAASEGLPKESSSASTAIIAAAIDMIFDCDNLDEGPTSALRVKGGSYRGSLLARYAEYVLKRNVALVGLTAMLWEAFVSEVQRYWEGGLVLPAMCGEPNHSCCLLHQKLQMLNCCIRAGEEQGSTPKITGQEETIPDDDAFEDAEMFEGELVDDDTCISPSFSPSKEIVGRPGAKQALSMCLLGSDIVMYEPEVQCAAVPCTEDVITQNAEALQMSSLQSDMAAFKAANPGCAMADFIRWYSPRDWLTPDGGEGECQLSARMSHEGNTWQRLWEEIAAAPVSEQNSLFDHKQCGDEVLAWLKTVPPEELLQSLVLTVLTVSTDTIANSTAGQLLQISDRVHSLSSFVSAQLAQSRLLDHEAMQELCFRFGELEAEASRAMSYMLVLPGCTSLVSTLLVQDEASGLSNEDREQIASVMFEEGFAGDETPSLREFILRRTAGDVHSTEVPAVVMRMYVAQGIDGRFTVATASSTDMGSILS